MYGDLAELWPLISAPEDYAREAGYWRQALRSKLGPGRHTLLELGVGGGNNLSHLTDDFDATAVDLSTGMLAHSRRLNPSVEHHVGDMRSVRLGSTFDAVIVHDAIDYMLTEDDLRAVFQTAAAHLQPGGVFIAAPDWFTETLLDQQVSCSTANDGETELVMIEFARPPRDPSCTICETAFLFVITDTSGTRVEADLHRRGLFPLATWLGLLDETGFRPEQMPYPVHEDGHDAWLLIGVLR